MLVAGGVTAAAVIGVGTVVVFSGGGSSATEADAPPSLSPGAVAQQFMSALATGDNTAAAGATDSSQAAIPMLQKSRSGMGTAEYHARLGGTPPFDPDATSLTIPADVTWSLPDGTPWKYPISVGMRRTGSDWKVHWTPDVLHPQLHDGQWLAYEPVSGDGALLDRNGQPLGAAPGYAAAVLPGVRTEIGNLNGTAGWRVAIIDVNGAPAVTLQEKAAIVAKSATVTLDKAVQDAAQGAVDQVPQQAAIVTLDTQSGEILAVAQNAAATGPIALAYKFEPGSTFKVVTAAAALENGGVGIDTPVECPGVATIGTRTIPNEGRFELGTVPLRQAFARSCNTTFGQLAADLPASALPAAAKQFGIGVDFTVAGITTNTGSVPTPASVAERVEAGIGQGKVQTTPFGMALAAATVATGKMPMPRMIREIDTTTDGTGSALPSGVAQKLRPMMREVVTGGTAQELNRFGAVHGKTGTAEFGDASSAHGWFMGYRDNLAFAVLVVNGGSSKAAVGVAASFLSALG